MSQYLRRQSVAELLRNALHSYRRHFLTLFIAAALLEIPFSVAFELVTSQSSDLLWALIAFLPYLCATSIAAGILTVLVSDVCLGNAPRVRRAYGRVFGPRFWPFFVTTMLANVMVILGLVALLVPGLVLLAWFLFVPIVIIVENLSGTAALSRSRRIGAGYHLRNVTVVLLLIALDVVLDAQLRNALDSLLTEGNWPTAFAAELVIASVSAVVVAFEAIVVVLIYYDLRARKEAYDSAALAEDLLR